MRTLVFAIFMTSVGTVFGVNIYSSGDVVGGDVLSRNAKTFMQPFSLYHHGRR